TEVQAGGKGVNVARTLKTLGEDCELLGLIAGQTGQYIDSGLEYEGIKRSLINVPGESRTSVIILGKQSDDGLTENSQTVINENGPDIDGEFIEKIVALFSERVMECDFAILKGSIHPGFSPTY